MVRQILCPTDFSKTSRYALECAASLASQQGAKLTVLHVTPTWPTTDHYPPLVDPVTLKLVTREEMLGELERFAKGAVKVSGSSVVAIRKGVATDEILKAAARFDLVVMGTHGRRGFEKWAMGSVTERVLHRSPCPVLSCSLGGQATKRPRQFRRILCAMDYSGASTRALEIGLSLAPKRGAQMTLIHVLEWAPEEVSRYGHFDPREYARFLEALALERLRKAVPRAPKWLKRTELVATGKAPDQILSRARLMGADLIVIGVHGRSKLDLAFFGSTVNRVVRDAPCPVLTVGNRRTRQ